VSGASQREHRSEQESRLTACHGENEAGQIGLALGDPPLQPRDLGLQVVAGDEAIVQRLGDRLSRFFGVLGSEASAVTEPSRKRESIDRSTRHAHTIASGSMGGNAADGNSHLGHASWRARSGLPKPCHEHRLT